MKLIVQIPCLNEEKTLPLVLNSLPEALDGIDSIEVLVIDDGSTDRTAAVAREHGVDHVVSMGRRRGLAAAFTAGLAHALRAGADIIVNMDGDAQYLGEDIAALIEPIVAGRAQMVVGERPISQIAHFSPVKKILQRVGSASVRLLSGVEVGDAPSGFRAISADTALRLNVFSQYTYTLEMLIQAGGLGIAIETVPVRVNAPTRHSRLASSMLVYVVRSAITVVRMFIVYRPFRFFFILGCVPFVLAIAAFLLSGFQAGGLAAFGLAATGFAWALAIVGDLLAINRRLLEGLQYRARKDDLKK